MEQTKSATLLSSEEAASQNFSTDNKISGGCVKCGCEVLIYYHYDTGKPVPNAPFVLTDSNQHVIEGKTDQNGLCLIYDMGCGTFDLLLDEGSDTFEPKETVKNNPVMQSNPAYAAIAGEYFALFLLLHKQGLVEYDASSSSDRYVDVDGAGLFTSIPPEYRKAYDRFWELDEKINAGSLELRRAVNKIQHSLAAEVADKGEGGNAAIMLFCQIILGCIPVVGQAMDAYSIGEWCWDTYEEPVLLEDKLHVAEGVLNVIGLVPGLGDAMKVSGKAILKALKKVAPEEIQFAMKIIRKLSDGNLVKGISKMRAELSVYGQKALKLLEDMKAALQKALKSSADDGWIVALMKDRFHKMVDFLDKLYKTFSDTVAYIERKFDEFIPHVVTRKAGSARSKGSVAEAAEAPKTAPHAESRAGEPARAESAPNKPASENAAGDSTVPSSKKPTSKKSEGAGEDASSGAKSEPAPAEKKANATPEGSESINAGSSKEPKPDKTSQKKKADEAEGKCDANSNKCHKEGEPVDMATGFVVDWRTDFEVSGLQPLTMKRYYRSGGERKPGLLGALWRSNWDMCLELEQGVVTLTDGEFNQSTFVLPDEGESLSSQANPEWRLSRQQGQLILLNCDGLRYRFEHAMGKRLLLTSITDRVGHEISLLWERGVLRWIELPDRRLVHVETEKRRITQLTLCDAQRQPLQTLARYTWDQQGFLLSVRAGDGSNFDYRYSREGWLLRWNDLAHTWVEHTYDEKGRSIQDRSSGGFWPGRFEYDDENLTSHYHSGFGGVVSYTRNERNYILCKRTADGGETHYEWQQNLLVAETDPLGNRTEYEHNDWGQITAVTLPDGAVHRYDYDDDGQLLAYTNPLGHVWQYQRNAQGQVVEVNDPEGREWLQSYTDQGLLATVIGPDGVLQRYYYNPQGFVSVIETDNLPAVRFFYDAQDRLTERHIARESGTQIRRWEYEGARQAPVRVVYEDGSATHFGYDVEGNLTSVLDALGQQHQFRYGAFDNLLESTDPLGATVRYHYNAEAEFAGVTNSHGDAWTYSFDECGRLSEERHYDGRVYRYAYDMAGRLTCRTAPDGSQQGYTHDALGRVTEVQCVTAEGATESVTTLDYDIAGRLLRASNADACVEYAYNRSGQVISERVNGQEILSDYDASGYRAQVDGLLAPLQQQWQSGRLSALGVGSHQALSFSHTDAGQESLRSNGAGFALSQSWSETGLLERQTLVNGGGGEPHHLERRYRYDALDRLVGIKDAHWGEQDFRLNGNGQVTAERRNGRWRQAKLFGYDSEQNLCEVSEIIAASGVPLSVSQAVSAGQRRYDGVGRIVERGDVRYEYDACGRLSRKREVRAGFRPKETRYEWDTQDRLRRVSLPDGARWRYGYDAFGRRVSKVREGQVASLQSVSKVQYQWDGDQLVGQVQYYADGTPAREVQWVYEPGSFRPLAQVERKGADTRLHYVVTDVAGTARELCSESGEVHWRGEQALWDGHREDRLPIGLKRYLGDAANEEVYCELRYQGQIYDAETGLYYNRHRYYDADSGQYISPDPIGLDGGINLYQYSPNPLTWVDPLGLSSECGIAGSVKWKGFNPKKNPVTGKSGLQGHFEKHGHEFGDITQNQYLAKAKEFSSKPLTESMQEAKVGNFVIKYDKSTGEIFVGHMGKREIRTYYKDDGRSSTPFQDAIDLAGEK